ncbi:MAG TPA: hypothetical protein PKA27_16195, partial [Fimbriimonadaceae bacterium]|nr:hypothetical protein [Fimbriimonadaceae bacterium]
MTDYIHIYHRGSNPSEKRTILVCHGTGGDEHSLVPFAESLLPGASILSPRGNVLEGTLPRFFRRLAEGVFDQEDLVLRAGQLATFVADSAKTYGFDPTKVIGFGYSNGANILHTSLMLHPEIASTLVLLRAMPTLPDRGGQAESDSKPVPRLNGKRVLLSQGDADPIV